MERAYGRRSSSDSTQALQHMRTPDTPCKYTIIGNKLCFKCGAPPSPVLLGWMVTSRRRRAARPSACLCCSQPPGPGPHPHWPQVMASSSVPTASKMVSQLSFEKLCHAIQQFEQMPCPPRHAVWFEITGFADIIKKVYTYIHTHVYKHI